jgi:hypothetical protein
MNRILVTRALLVFSILALSNDYATAQIFVGGVDSSGSVFIRNSTLADDFFDSWSETSTGNYFISQTINFPAGGATIGTAATMLSFDSGQNLFTASVDIFADAGIDPSGTDSEAQAMVVNELFFTTFQSYEFALTGANVGTGGAIATYMFQNTTTGQSYDFGETGTLDAGSYVLRTTHMGSSTTINGVFSGVQSASFSFGLQLTAVPEPTTATIPLLLGLCAATRRRR